jgi:hypothetical protein
MNSLAEETGKNNDGEGYCKHNFPLIIEHCGKDMACMQANSSPYTYDETLRETAHHGRQPTSWPANSRHLNYIKTPGFIMKQRIKAYKDRSSRIQPLRDAVNILCLRI